MVTLVLWVLVFCLASAASIVLTGDRGLISGNLLAPKNAFALFFHWKFIIAMALAVVSRLTFILVNNSLLSIPRLARNSTTVTTLILTLSYVFVIGANAFWLKERLTPNQGVGAALILVGVIVITR